MQMHIVQSIVCTDVTWKKFFRSILLTLLRLVRRINNWIDSFETFFLKDDKDEYFSFIRVNSPLPSQKITFASDKFDIISIKSS